MSKKEKSKHKEGVFFEDQVPLEVALDYLKSLHDNLAGGGVRIENGSSELMLSPPGCDVTLRLRARSKDGENGLRLDLSWQAPEPERENGKSGLRITGTADPTKEDAPNGSKKRKTAK